MLLLHEPSLEGFFWLRSSVLSTACFRCLSQIGVRERQSERANEEIQQVLISTVLLSELCLVLPLVPADVTGLDQEIVPV